MRKMVKLFLCIVACICLNGCVTRYRTNGEVLEYQRQIDLLEERIRARDRAIDSGIRTIESVANRSRGMEGTIDDIIREIDEYQRAVERLFNDYREVRSGDTPQE